MAQNNKPIRTSLNRPQADYSCVTQSYYIITHRSAVWETMEAAEEKVLVCVSWADGGAPAGRANVLEISSTRSAWADQYFGNICFSYLTCKKRISEHVHR